MKRSHRTPRIAAFLVLSALACGDSVTDLGSPENGTMTATVDGDSWSAVQIQAVNSGTLVSIAGSDVGLLAIGFAFQNAGPGTYEIGPGQVTNATVTQSSTTVWTAGSTLGSGSITLSTLTNNQAIGTFEFVAELTQGTGDPTRTVTSGSFSVSY